MPYMKPEIEQYITDDFINSILDKYNIHLRYCDIIELWNRPYRYYHTANQHMIPMLAGVFDEYISGKFNEKSMHAAIIAVLFHDIIYFPWKNDNENNSIDFLKFYSDNHDNSVLLQATQLIESTSNINIEVKDNIGKIFRRLDFMPFYQKQEKYGLQKMSLSTLIKYERQIFKEYQFVGFSEYIEKRTCFLDNLIKNNPIGFNHFELDATSMLIDYIRSYIPKIAIYAGSFNPFHKGHLNIVEKLSRIFDKVIIAKGINPAKQFNQEEFSKNLSQLKDLLPQYEVSSYSGLITDFISSQQGECTLVRGIRNGFDLEAENNFAAFIRDINPDIRLMYIPCDKEFEHISSSAIRSLYGYGERVYNRYLPEKIKCNIYDFYCEKNSRNLEL